MKILRFNDDRIGVIKNDNMVVDVSDTVSARKAKGPQRVMEEIIEGWRKYRRRFEKLLATQDGVPVAGAPPEVVGDVDQRADSDDGEAELHPRPTGMVILSKRSHRFALCTTQRRLQAFKDWGLAADL